MPAMIIGINVSGSETAEFYELVFYGVRKLHKYGQEEN